MSSTTPRRRRAFDLSPSMKKKAAATLRQQEDLAVIAKALAAAGLDPEAVFAAAHDPEAAAKAAAAATGAATAAAAAQEERDDAEEVVAAVVDKRRLPDLDFADLFGDVPALRDHVNAIAFRKGYPAAMPGAWALTVLSALVADRVRMRIVENEETGSAWTLPLHFWTLGVYSSGLQKTGCVENMGTDVVAELEVAAKRRWAGAYAFDRRRRHDARGLADGRGKKGATDDERDRAWSLLDEPALAEPRLLFNVTTPEEFEARMFRSGFVALFQEEGGAFFGDFVHQERSKLSASLGAYSGARGSKDTRGDSRGGDPAPFHERHGVIGLFVQPHVLSPRSAKDQERLAEAAQQGLFARFMVHQHTGSVPALDLDDVAVKRAACDYDALLRGLAFDLPDTGPQADAMRDRPDASVHEFARLHPFAPRDSFERNARYAGRILETDPDAARRLLDFQSAWRRRGDDFERDDELALAATARRLGELAARLAGLLAVARSGRLDRLQPVSLSDAERAIRCCERFAWPHAEAAMQRSQAGELETLESRILDRLATGRDKDGSPWRGRWLTVGQFRDRIAKHWPEVRGVQLRDRHDPLSRAFVSLAQRGVIEMERTPKSYKVRLPEVART